MSFIYNEISSKEMGLHLERTPIPIKARQKTRTTEVPNRVESLSEVLQEFEDITYTLICNIVDQSKIDSIYEWLNGSGKLIFSNRPDIFYKAFCTEAIIPEFIGVEAYTMQITFTCKPFKYATDNNTIELTTPQTLAIGGSYPCEPVYKIYGSGNINFIVNGETLQIKDVLEHITIDTSRLIAYKNDTVLVNKTIGLYPMLGVGDNSISWTGTVTKVEITKNERWL